MDQPRLSLCMIVRDEAECLGHCLSSAAGVVDEMVVVDTGSRDGTVSIAESFGARVFYLDWQDDFSAARNHGLDRAAGDWLLVLDADERLEEDGGLRRLLLQPEVEGYFLLLVNHFSGDPGRDRAGHHALRLFRNRAEYRFTGRVHETLAPEILRSRIDAFRFAAGVRVHHYGYRPGDPALPHKKERNLALVLKDLEERPGDPLVRFNAGMEFFRQGRWAEALALFAGARAGMEPGAPYHAALVRQSILCHLFLGRADEARAEIERGLAEMPDFSELYFLRGLILQAEGRYGEALLALADCLAAGEPPSRYGSLDGIAGYRSHLARAHCHRMLGDPRSEAEALIEAAAAGAAPAAYLARLTAIIAELPAEERERLAKKRGSPDA